MTVGKGTDDVEGIVAVDEGLVPQESPQGLDLLHGPGGEVGDGALPDLAVFPPSLTQEDGGRRVPVGDNVYVHGNAYGHVRSPRQRQTSQLNGNVFAMSPHHFVAKITCLGRFCCWSQGELRPSTRPISATPSSSTGSSRPETQFAMGREFADLMVPGYAPMRLVGPLPVWFTSRNAGSAPALPVSGPTQVHECSGPRGR